MSVRNGKIGRRPIPVRSLLKSLILLLGKLFRLESMAAIHLVHLGRLVPEWGAQIKGAQNQPSLLLYWLVPELYITDKNSLYELSQAIIEAVCGKIDSCWAMFLICLGIFNWSRPRERRSSGITSSSFWLSTLTTFKIHSFSKSDLRVFLLECRWSIKAHHKRFTLPNLSQACEVE